MPLQQAPDGSWQWVDPTTGAVTAANPLTAGGPTTTTPGAVQVPASQNIDPNASARPTTTPTTTQPATAGAAGASATAIAAPQVSPDVPAITPTGPAGPDGKPTYTLDDIVQQNQLEIDQAYKVATQASSDAAAAAQRMRDYEAGKGGPNQNAGVYDPGYQAAQQQFNDLTNQAVSAQTRIAAAQNARATALTTAIQNQALQPDLIKKYQADAANATAQANEAQANADKIKNAAPGEQALVAAQTLQSTAQAAYANAQAAKETATTQAQKDLYTAQAAAYQQQANTGASQQKLLDAQATLTAGATTDETQARANYENALAGERTAAGALTQAQVKAGLPQAQVGLAQGQTAEAQSNAALNLAKIQQAQQGPLYGLSDQVNAIRAIAQQVWGPGGTGNPDHANDLLDQYVSATIGGTTPYAASVAAQNALQNQFQTQAAMYNQASNSAASRANAYMGLGGNVLATLAGMNANAPAGSTALVGAFQDVLNQMAQRTAQGQFAPPTQPTGNALAPFLQNFAGGSRPAAPGGTGLPTPTPTAAPLPPGNPPMSAQPSGQGGQGVTINISGGGQAQPQPQPMVNTGNGGVQTQQAVPAPAPQGTALQGNASIPAIAQQQAPQMPNYLSGMQSASPDFVHQLWAKELGTGNVTSPFAAMAA